MKMRYFNSLHPSVAMFYFVAVLILTMLCSHPTVSVLSLLSAAGFALFLKGGKSFLGTLRFLVPMMVLIIVANPLFSHRGVTLLFLLFDQWVTLEAICYGFASACRLAAVVLWFICYQEVMTSDKFLFLFGQAAPAAALLITLTLRLVPELQQRGRQIREIQRQLWGEDERLTQKLAAAVRNLSILLTWSMENAVETADSMKARGFGQRRRTTFHLFHFDSRDAVCLGLITALTGIVAIGRIYGFGVMEFYPRMTSVYLGQGSLWQLLAALLLMMLPLLLEGREAVRWRSYSLNT